jgi:hypothetical protein
LTKTLSSAPRTPTESAPLSAAASPRLETSTRGGYGIHSSSKRANGIEQQVAVGPAPTPEHGERVALRPRPGEAHVFDAQTGNRLAP